jgi:hypothetical protein
MDKCLFGDFERLLERNGAGLGLRLSFFPPFDPFQYPVEGPHENPEKSICQCHDLLLSVGSFAFSIIQVSDKRVEKA